MNFSLGKFSAVNSLNPEMKASASIIACVFTLLFLFGKLGGLQSLELGVYDHLIQARAKFDEPPQAYSVSILLLDENDIKQYQHPFSDEFINGLLLKLEYFQPLAIGLDIYRDRPTGTGTENLVNTINAFDNIILINKFKGDHAQGIPVMPALDNPIKVGFSDIVMDDDKIVRRGLLYLSEGESRYYSFALRLALTYLKQENIIEEYASLASDNLKLGRSEFVPFETNDGGYVNADKDGYQFLLDFTYNPESFHFLSLHELLGGSIDPSLIKDKIVVIGISAESVVDNFSIPYSNVAGSHQTISGTALHGLIANQIVNAAIVGQSPLTAVSDILEYSLLLAYCILGSFLTLKAKSMSRLMFVAALGILLPLSLEYVGFYEGIWIPMATSSMAWLMSSALTVAFLTYHEKRQRDQALAMFGNYLSPTIAEYIWNQRILWLQGGKPVPQKLNTTILFSDIKGFTKVADQLEPEVFMEWLNEYLDAMTSIIITHEGVVVRFIGDAILAAFGVPIPLEGKTKVDDAINAVQCALEMQSGLARLNKHWKTQNLPVVAARIGVHSGVVVSGSMGNQSHREYAIQGDDVNIAARLETFRKMDFNPTLDELFENPCRILIGDNTEALVRGHFKVEALGAFNLTRRMVSIYRLFGEVGSG